WPRSSPFSTRNSNSTDVDLRHARAVAREGDHALAVRPARMRMRVLRPVHRIARALHPAQRLPRMLKILCQRVTGLAPLRPLIARKTVAQVPPRAGGGIDDLQPLVRVIRVAKNPPPRAVRGDVPRVVLRDGAHLARGPIHAAERAWPDREHKVAGGAEKRLVH